jgi:hypothetical protein
MAGLTDFQVRVTRIFFALPESAGSWSPAARR